MRQIQNVIGDRYTSLEHSGKCLGKVEVKEEVSVVQVVG